MAKSWYEKLSDSDIEFIKSIHSSNLASWDERMKTLMDRFDKSERSIRRGISKLGLAKKKEHEELSEQFEEAKKKEHSEKNYYLITWAQNNTPIHNKMLKNMKAYADFLDAEILVVAGRYRNPTSLKASKSVKTLEEKNYIKWDDSIKPYLTANRHNIHKYVQILADVKVQPTAENPLTGFEGFSGLESSILGHPKQSLKSLPILDGYPHKVLMSTGAITRENYTDTKAGKKGEFNHIYGFLVVEIRDEEVFHIRNVNVDDSGEFNDLYFNVCCGKVTQNKSIEGIRFGDIHSGFHNPVIINRTFEMLDVLNPKHVVLDDVFDGKSISHHHERDPFKKYSKHMSSDSNLELEIYNLMELLDIFSRFEKVVIVRSNHDTHVDRYLRERDWKRDVENALTYMELSTIILKGLAPKGIIPYLINERFPEFICLSENDSFPIMGIENALHGDKGASGSRGSITQFKKLNVKTNTNHTHTPEIQGGAYVGGTTTFLRLDYNSGLSPWMNAHIITDSLGKRQMIMFADDDFTTLDKFILDEAEND